MNPSSGGEPVTLFSSCFSVSTLKRIVSHGTAVLARLIGRTFDIVLVLLVIECGCVRVRVSRVHSPVSSSAGWPVATFSTLLHLPPPLYLELRHIKPIHIVHVGVNPPRQLHTVIENLPSVPCETFPPELESSIDELDVRPFSKSVVDHRLVLIDSYRTGGIDDVSACFGLGVCA